MYKNVFTSNLELIFEPGLVNRLNFNDVFFITHKCGRKLLSFLTWSNGIKNSWFAGPLELTHSRSHTIYLLFLSYITPNIYSARSPIFEGLFKTHTTRALMKVGYPTLLIHWNNILMSHLFLYSITTALHLKHREPQEKIYSSAILFVCWPFSAWKLS